MASNRQQTFSYKLLPDEPAAAGVALGLPPLEPDKRSYPQSEAAAYSIAPRLAAGAPNTGSQLAMNDVVAYRPAASREAVVCFNVKNITGHVVGNGNPAFLAVLNPTGGGLLSGFVAYSKPFTPAQQCHPVVASTSSKVSCDPHAPLFARGDGGAWAMIHLPRTGPRMMELTMDDALILDALLDLTQQRHGISRAEARAKLATMPGGGELLTGPPLEQSPLAAELAQEDPG